MDARNESADMCKCGICGNEISKITQTQQASATSQKWAKYGLCSVACSAPPDILRKNHLSDNIANPRIGYNGRSLIQLQRFESQEYKYGLSIVRDTKVHDKKKLNCNRIILFGKMIALISLLVAFLLYYTEDFTGALISLSPIVLGLIIYRFGIWKKCRIT